MTTIPGFTEILEPSDNDRLLIRDISESETKFISRESLVGTSFGSFSMDGNTTATTIATAGTYTKVLGTTTNESSSFVTLSNGRITYTGVEDRHFIAIAALSTTASANNKIAAFKFAKNGTVSGNPIRRAISTGADIGAAPVQWDGILSTNDYIELFITCITDTTSITVEDLHLMISGTA